jgi:predicted NUDIX family NTP pyrophosphohydrolase
VRLLVLLLMRRATDRCQLEIIPEVDRAEWFALPVARKELVKDQVEIIDALLELRQINSGPPPSVI